MSALAGHSRVRPEPERATIGAQLSSAELQKQLALLEACAGMLRGRRGEEVASPAHASGFGGLAAMQKAIRILQTLFDSDQQSKISVS